MTTTRLPIWNECKNDGLFGCTGAFPRRATRLSAPFWCPLSDPANVASAALLLGDWAHFLELTLIPDYRGFLLVILPPGSFIVLAFLLAGKRLLDRALAERRDADRTQLLIRLRLFDGQTLLARITRRSGLALGLREEMLVYTRVKGVALV